MSHVPQALMPDRSNAGKRLMLVVPPAVAGLIALLALQYPLWACAALVVLVVVAALARWPEMSTLTVVFILYSNAAKIAVEFHGVPYPVGVGFILLLLIPLYDYFVVRREPVVVNWSLLLLVLFVTVQLAGAMCAKHPDVASKELFTSLSEGVLLYFLIINVVRTHATLRRVIWALVAAGAVVALAPLYQQFTGNFDSNLGGFGQVSNAAFDVNSKSGTPGEQRRLAGSVGEQNRYAQVMLMLVPLAIFRCWGETDFRLKVAAAVAAALVTGAVALTFSRGAAVGMVVLLLTMTGLRYIRLKHLAGLLVASFLMLLAIPQFGERMAKFEGTFALLDSGGTDYSSADGSLKSRVTEMGAAGLAYLDHPLIGVGPGMFRYHYREYAEMIGIRIMAEGRRSHSILLGLAAETGSCGLFLFGAIVTIALRDLNRARRRWLLTDPQRANLAASFVMVIVAYMTTAMFLHLAYIRFFWLMMALASVAGSLGNESAPNSSADKGEES